MEKSIHRKVSTRSKGTQEGFEFAPELADLRNNNRAYNELTAVTQPTFAITAPAMEASTENVAEDCLGEQGAEAKLPQKRYYRQRAHANPMSDHDLDYPLCPEK